MQLSVVIPTYNDANLLADTVAPLLRDPATGEVIVVVDGADDGSFALLQQLATRDARIRPFWIENRGRAGARQYGLERARQEIVLMLDADVVAGEGLVSGHAAWHDGSRQRLVVGYMPPPPVRTRRRDSFIITAYAAQYEATCAEYERDPRFIFRRLWGGNISVPKDAVVAAGGCDPGVGIRYGEDVELGLRLRPLGLQPVFDRTLLAEHRIERSVPGFRTSARQLGAGLVLLEALYPGSVDIPQWRASGVGGTLRRFALRPRGNALLSGGSGRLVSLLGSARMWRYQARAAAFLERLELQQGMQEQSRRRRPAAQS